MCGIAGFFNTGISSHDYRKTVETMTDSLIHRGPDAAGWWADAKAEMVLGHRRLSILDLSESGIQPMHSGSGRFVISFNGEVYNFKELRVRLEEIGQTFHSGTDTEVMLGAVEAWGVVEAVKQFRGMFAFALYDRQEQRCYLVRDRFGIKPCYYARAGKGWTFASQLGALKKHPLFEANLNETALGLFLLLNHIPDSHCVYQEASKVHPGEMVCFDLKIPHAPLQIIRYWNTGEEILASFQQPIRAPDEECIELVRAEIRKSVELRMIADVPFGAFLSGGIDSSLVVAMMQEISADPVNTFTIRSERSSYDEGDVARSFAKHIGTNHTELIVTGKEAADVFPLIPDMYDEPFSDASQIPTYLVSKLARTAVTVSLSGDGGDEVFGGYNRYFRAAGFYQRYGSLPRSMRKLIAGLLASGMSIWAVELLNYLKPLSRRIRNPEEKLSKTARCLAAGDETQLFLELLMQYHGGNTLLKSQSALDWKLLQREMKYEPLDGLDLVQQMMFQDAVGYLPNDILTKLDRASMAVSLESRVPLLDHELFRLAWRLRPELKIREGSGKWILKKILESYLPDPSVLKGEKQGFAVPIGDWFRGELKSWLCDTLSSEAINRTGLLNPDAVEQLIVEHMTHKRNHENILWSLLLLQQWIEKS